MITVEWNGARLTPKTDPMLRACERAMAYARLMDGGAWDWACRWSLLAWTPIYRAGWLREPESYPNPDGRAWAAVAATPALFGLAGPIEADMATYARRTGDGASTLALAHAGAIARTHPDAWAVAAMQTLSVTDPDVLPRPTLDGIQSSLAAVLGPAVAQAACSLAVDGRWGGPYALDPKGRHVAVPDGAWSFMSAVGLKPPEQLEEFDGEPDF